MATKRSELFRGSAETSPLLGSSTDVLIAENTAMRQTTQVIDDAISVGMAASERLHHQNATLRRSGNTLERIMAQIPIVGDLTSKIEIKRKRDRLIIGSLIGFLMFFCVWYLFG